MSGFGSLASIYLLIAFFCIVITQNGLRLPALSRKRNSDKLNVKKTATNLVMMLATKQAVELSAYFVMVYFPVHSVTLVWQMLLELRNSLNCYPLNLFKLQWSLKVSSKLKNLYWDAINIFLPLRLYERVQDYILLFQINWILYSSVCYCRIVLSAGLVWT